MAKKKKVQNARSHSPVTRPPVVAVMGHIDHGKSTLLDYIRKENVVASEAGGITQHISAYEFEHTTKEGVKSPITFLDTPGHEAFSGIRSRGAAIADVAILVVSAEDGVKPQTLEALRFIKEAQTPFVVAITKIDLPSADVEKTKASLTENEIYLENHGGDTPFVPVSAKTGEGINDLLDLLILAAELEELTATPGNPASGIVIETNTDKQKGLSASMVIKDGTLSQGMAVASEDAFAPVRIMEKFTGKPLKEATFSSPVKIYGWNTLPPVGSPFVSFATKKEAETFSQEHRKETHQSPVSVSEIDDETAAIPLIVVADTTGTLQAVVDKIKKIDTDRVDIRIISQTVGTITDSDVKLASTHENALLVGFGTIPDTAARNTAERLEIPINTFSIIYELIEWLEKSITDLRPKVDTEEKTGLIKVLRTFTQTKTKQVVGGRVDEGAIAVGDTVKILRRGEELGRGIVKNLQHQQIKASKIESGEECGLEVETKKEIARGDHLEAFQIVRS